MRSLNYFGAGRYSSRRMIQAPLQNRTRVRTREEACGTPSSGYRIDVDQNIIGALVRQAVALARDLAWPRGSSYVEVLIICWGLAAPSLRASASARRCLMPTTSPSAALVPVAPMFSTAERLALAGFLAGYSGLTRQAYELDLRQYASWCQTRHLALFAARRADIESFARDLEARGRPPCHHHPAAVHHRRTLPARRRGRAPGPLARCARPQAATGL
jgi:hypothetical protein